MEFIDETPSTLKEYFEVIAKAIFSHREYDKIIEDSSDNIIFPNPSSSILEYATENINKFDSSYYILHTAHYTGNYSLVLTKFETKIYKVFYVHNEDNNISYSYYVYE